MMKTTLVFGALICLGSVLARPDGAPLIACESMTPQHAGNIPQTSPSPYTVSVGSSRVRPQADITVSIKAASNDMFRGFFIQARDADGSPVGTFDVGDEVQAIDCPGGVMNAATHVNNMNKTSIEVGWTAPSTPTDVTFSFSIVRIYEEYWTGITVPLEVTFEP